MINSMADEIFKLGNFSNLPKGDPPAEAAHADTPASDTKSGEAGNHPAVVPSEQARFNYHDGRPLLELELGKIVPNQFQPRRIFNEEKLQELSESIKAHGIIQPLVVVERGEGMYEIIVGERRLRAAKMAGLSKVPVFVNPAISSEAKLELALIENIQRADLNPIEEAKAYQRLHAEFSLSVSEIARRVGKDVSTVSNLLRLLNLPAEIQRALIEELLTEGQARPLLSLRDKEEMLQMFKIVVREQMKVREIERRVREIRGRKIKVKDMFTPDPFVESLENMLRTKFGTRVEVNKGAKGGKITIEFYSDEELNDIISKIS